MAVCKIPKKLRLLSLDGVRSLSLRQIVVEKLML